MLKHGTLHSKFAFVAVKAKSIVKLCKYGALDDRRQYSGRTGGRYSNRCRELIQHSKLLSCTSIAKLPSSNVSRCFRTVVVVVVATGIVETTALQTTPETRSEYYKQ